MTDQELRRLSRQDLVEIIYELQKTEAELKQENEDLRAQLEKRKIILSQSGSIAEAALALNNVFQAAQDAANCYLHSVQKLSQEENAEQAPAKPEHELDMLLREARALLEKNNP